jgi:glycosyltransferase involved in cell wall biosynthesis
MPALRGRANHVLMVTSTLARGGCERQMLATTTGLLRRGYTVAIFALAKAPPGEPTFEAEFAALGVDMSCAIGCDDMASPSEMAADEYGLGPFMPLIGHFSVVRLGAAVGQAIRRFRPAVVHCWSEPATVIAGFPASALGVERILLQLVNVSPIQRGAPEFSLYRDAYLLLLRNPDVVLLNISRTNARALEQWLEVPEGTVKILYNGFLPDSMGIAKRRRIAAFRRQIGPSPMAPTVGALMRFAPEKDPELWLETAAIIAAARPDVRFVLAGYGELAEPILRMTRALGLSERVALLGPRTDVGAIYAVMDVFLMTSRFEGTPNVLIEAQAAGVPVVAPLVGGVGEAMRDGVTGRLVTERAADKLAEAVVRVLDDPRWRKRAARQGPKFVASQFKLRRKIDRTVGFYNYGRAAPASEFAALPGRLRAYFQSPAPFWVKWLRRRRLPASSDQPVLIPRRVNLR